LPRQSQNAKLQAHPNRKAPLRTLLLCALVIAACGKSGKNDAARRDTLTERQHDSILARSQIPGAKAVGRAMTAADSMSSRVRASDTVRSDTLP